MPGVHLPPLQDAYTASGVFLSRSLNFLVAANPSGNEYSGPARDDRRVDQPAVAHAI
jgi:hypothetical protein